MKYVTEIQTSPAEHPITYSKGADGTVYLTRRWRGAASELSSRAQGYNVGNITSVSPDESNPISGSFKVHSVKLEVDGPGWATLEVTYSNAANGTAIGGVNVGGNSAETTEVLDWQLLEKPITDAPFWANCEGASSPQESMKRVQLYVEAPTESQADALLENLSDNEKKMAYKMQAGTTHFWVPAPTLTKQETSSTAPKLSNVGKVSKPEISRVPIPSDMEWLAAGARVTWNGQAYITEQSWIGAEYWDRDLYKEAEE